MKINNLQNDHYLILSYNSLIANKLIHYFLFLADICIILLQILEIYHNNYKALGSSNIQSLSFISIVMKEMNKIKVGIKFLIYLILIIIETICCFILNHINLTRNNFLVVIINLNEIIFQRIGVLLMFHFLFIFKGIYLIIGIIFTLPFIINLIRCFSINHLYIFFFELIKYPYDSFSKVIDLHLLLVKIFLAISGMSNSYNLSKFFYVLSLFILLFLQIYLTYLMFFKSYYLMNNVSLNKIRYSILLSNCLIIILVLIINSTDLSNAYLIICFANIFILSLLLVWIFYNPYHYIKFDKDDNEENAFYYFFVLDRNKNKNLLLEMKIEEHRNKCGRCNLCKKYSEAKINEKFENVDLFYIIYNNSNYVLSLMNKIVREIRKQGTVKTFSNVSYFLLNLIYIYYMGIMQNDYCFFLNTELIYHLINSQNEQYLEEYKIYLNRIKYTNNFIVKANEIIENFYKIFDEKKIEKKYEIIFNFGNLLDELKYKEIKNNSNNLNNYNSNNGNTTDKNLNCSNLLTICSIFYEELYNESISNSRIFIRDSQNLLEDLINNNSKNHRLITFEINSHNFQVKIIRAGGYINKYENTILFDLFPEIFKNRQIALMKKILLTSNSGGQKHSKNNKSGRLKNKDSENQYLNFSFLIEEKDENNIYYKLLNLEMNLVILKDIQTIFYLNGSYKIDKDIIITEQRKNVEFLLHFGNKEQEQLIEGSSKDNKFIIKKKHGNKYLGNKKLVEDENSLKGCKHYRVYHFLLPSKKNVYSRISKHDLNNLVTEYIDDKMNASGNSDKLIFNDVASQSSSVTSSVSRNNLMLYNRGNKQSQNGEDISKGFLNSKYILWIGIFIMLIAIVIEFAILKMSNLNLLQKISFYLNLSDFALYFNRLFCSILSLSCLGNSPDTQQCHNHIEHFTKLVMNITVDNSTSFGGYEMHASDYFLNFQELLFYQEQIFSQMLEVNTETLTNQLAEINDKEFLHFFEENLIHFEITQSYENNVLSLSLKQENLTFTDAILLITSRFTILTKEFEYLEYPIYILDKIGEENSFKNINKKDKLNPYQENFYLLILDNSKFFGHLNYTISQIEKIISEKENKFKIYVYFIFGFNAFLYLIIFLFLFWYISIHLIIIFQILRNIYTFLNEKLGEILIKDIMRKKIDNLKLILSFYEKDVNATINELNIIYSNYKESYNLKIKEETKNVKKERNENDNKNKNINIFKLLNFQYFKIFFSYSSKRNLYIYSIFFVIIFAILLFAIYIIIWLLYFNKENYAKNWLYLSRELAKSTNDIMVNFLLMVYTNQTFTEVSSNLPTKDFTSHIYEKFTNLYKAGGFFAEIEHFIVNTEDSIKYDCKEFYQNLDNDFFVKLIDKYNSLNDTFRLNNTLETFCYISNVMTFKNYKTSYMQLFNPIERIMQQFKSGEYSEIFEFVEENNITKVIILFFITYIYLIDLMNENIRNIYTLLIEEISRNINIMGIIYLIAFIHLVTSVFFIFSRNMDKDCQAFIQMRKIFKVCNINE